PTERSCATTTAVSVPAPNKIGQQPDTANKTMSKETNRISYPPGVNHVPRPAPRHNPYGIETYSIVLYIGKPGNFTGAGENILHRFQNFLLLPRSNTFLTGGKTLPSFHF